MKTLAKWLLGICVAVAVLGIIVIPTVGNWAGSNNVNLLGALNPQPTVTELSVRCDLDEGAINHDQNRADADFEAKLKEARDNGTPVDESYREIAEDNMSKSAKWLAQQAYHVGLWHSVNDTTGLVSAEDDSCYSQQGQKLMNDMMVVLKASVITEGNVSSNAFNSGYDPVSGTYSVNDTKGIYGDMSGIKVELPNGTAYQVLIRCHNYIYSSAPSGWTPVKTDNPPPPAPPEEPYTPPEEPYVPPEVPPWEPPTPPEQPEPVKDLSEDPYNQGNAPVGGGQNVDPGPGEYVAPEEMEQHQPPAEEYVAPVAPDPVPEPEPEQPFVPDPAPAPPVEQADPAPEEAAEGTSCAPGKDTC